MDLNPKGRVAVVTGGSKGLGKAIAYELLAEGARVAVCARGGEELGNTVKELSEKTGGEVFSLVADVTKPRDVSDFISRTAERFGGLDILVNNAGRAQPGTFETLTDEQWRADIDVKLFSMIWCSRAAIPYMKRNGWGRIINMSAVQGKQPESWLFATSVNRAACTAFTKALAIELAPHNILVNSILLGFIETPQWENIRMKRAPEMNREEFFKQMAERHVLLKRFGKPEEVAGMVAFLASERASYITGAAIDVNGGIARYL